MDREIQVAALLGSLRQGSFNQGLLRGAMLLQPEGMRIYEVSIRDLPHYDEDRERAGDPPEVRSLKDGIRQADAILVVTPEYNYSIPGVLKNAIDWASRPSGKSVLDGKPAAIMGASAGRSGTMRAQLHLRQIFVTLNILPINEPQVYVTFARDKFNPAGDLIDQPTQEQIRQHLAALEAWTLRLSGRPNN